MTKDEKEFYDLLLERRSDYQEELEYLLGEREATDDPELLQDVDDDIKRVRRILDIIEIKIGA